MAKLTEQELELIRKSISDRVKTPDDVLLATLRAVLSGGIANVDIELLRVFTDEINARGIDASAIPLGESKKTKKLRLTESQLRRTIRKTIQETFWNKYGQPLGSRYRGGPLHQSLGHTPRPKEKYNQMIRLLRGYQRKCNHATIGNEMHMSGVWIKLAMGLLRDISCYDGTKEPVQCKLKFQGKQLIFDEVADLESFLNEPELLRMQREETEKMNVKYGEY